VTSAINPAVLDESNASFTLTDGSLVAQADFVMVLMNTPITIDVLGNDSGPNGDPMTITDPGQPANGTVSLVNNRILYTPGQDFLGADSFIYTVHTSTKQANATVTVQVVNQIFYTLLPVIRR
jgi:hypothetical protein